jgi:hypothetical protein
VLNGVWQGDKLHVELPYDIFALTKTATVLSCLLIPVAIREQQQYSHAY